MSDLQEILRIGIHYAIKEPVLGILLLLLLAGAAVSSVDVLLGALGPRVRLDPRQRARLALAAPYFVMHGFRPGDLAGLTPFDRRRVRAFLHRDWGISDRTAALARLDGLVREGHRSDPHLRDPDQPAADLEIVDRSLLAWDAMRIVFLARCCFACGYLDEGAVWSATDEAARLARGRFHGWAEWGRSFVAGRVIWAEGAGDEYEAVVERLLRKGGSEWSRTLWEVAVSA